MSVCPTCGEDLRQVRPTTHRIEVLCSTLRKMYAVMELQSVYMQGVIATTLLQDHGSDHASDNARFIEVRGCLAHYLQEAAKLAQEAK